jgi:glycerate dehydrogenase
MKIVVLDGHTLNPGDLDWKGLEQFGELTVYERTAEDQIVERSRDAQILFTNKTPLKKNVLQHLPALNYIGVLATGYNVIDTDFAASRGIPVVNVPGYGTASVVQLTMALLLELCQNVRRHSDSVYAGEWNNSPDFCYWKYPLTELAGKTIGIVGYGSIGQQVGHVAAAFGMRVLGHSRTRTDQSRYSYFRWTDIEDLLRSSDVISLHCPLLPETKNIINSISLAMMKRTAFLINTSRGPLIHEEDLAHALNAGIIAGAALDVLSTEPPVNGNVLFNAKNCIITPHIAWATREARLRLMQATAQNLRAFLSGNPINVVNHYFK